MRRSEREIKNIDEIEQILQKAEVCRLGLSDTPYPYILPLNFGYTRIDDSFTLYFHCAKEGHKIDLIKKNPNAAFEIDIDHKLLSNAKCDSIACTWTYLYQSIVGGGTIQFVENTKEKKEIMMKMMFDLTGRSDFSIEEKMIEHVCVFKLNVTHLSAKRHNKT